jgi:hypothetical protein
MKTAHAEEAHAPALHIRLSGSNAVPKRRHMSIIILHKLRNANSEY